MSKILNFKVEIEGLENKIWQDIEISDRSTMADFNSLAYHLYNITYNGGYKSHETQQQRTYKEIS